MLYISEGFLFPAIRTVSSSSNVAVCPILSYSKSEEEIKVSCVGSYNSTFLLSPLCPDPAKKTRPSFSNVAVKKEFRCETVGLWVNVNAFACGSYSSPFSGLPLSPRTSTLQLSQEHRLVSASANA